MLVDRLGVPHRVVRAMTANRFNINYGWSWLDGRSVGRLGRVRSPLASRNRKLIGPIADYIVGGQPAQVGSGAEGKTYSFVEP